MHYAPPTSRTSSDAHLNRNHSAVAPAANAPQRIALLAKRPKLKKAKPASRGSTAGGNSEGVEALKSLAIVVAVALAVAGGGLWGLNALWRYAIDLAEFQLVPAKQVVIGPDGQAYTGKAWVDFPALQSHWLVSGRETGNVLARNASLFERRLTALVRGELMASPWVREVEYVRREFPNRLTIRLSLRQPAVKVAYGERTDLLDEDRVVLDPRFFSPTPEVNDRPVIRFESDPGLFERGKALEDNGVKGAMFLLDVLEGMEVDERSLLEAVPLAEIVVRETPPEAAGRNRSLTLIPRAGGKVVWGRPPVQGLPRSPAEAPYDVKLSNLVSILQTYGDRLALYEVDVTRQQPVVRPVESGM